MGKYLIDIDGIICSNTNGDYEKAIPYEYVINNVVNALYDEKHTIILKTARGIKLNEDLRSLTEKQLEDWGVKYHKLIMKDSLTYEDHDILIDALDYDYFIDDKSYNSAPEVLISNKSTNDIISEGIFSRTINKYWGQEKWFREDFGREEDKVYKLLMVDAGKSILKHKHENKDESFYVVKGIGSIKLEESDTLKVYEYIIDSRLHKNPIYVAHNMWHTVTAYSDLILLEEANGFFPEDSIRYQDKGDDR